MRAFSLVLVGLVLAGILSGVLYSTPNAAATSTTTWTSTADFDAGIKSQTQVPRNWFINNGVSQPENFINSPAAEYYNGRTYIAFQGPDSTGNAHRPTPYVTYYDHAASAWGPVVRVVAQGPLTDDDHGAPALLVDASGYIHVFYGAHAKPLKHARSTNSGDISTWTVGADAVADLFTYPHPFLMANGDIYVVGRTNPGGVPDGGNGIYVKSTDGGTTWGAENTILTVKADNGTYIGIAERYGTKVYLTWSTSERKHAYVAYLETADGNMYCKASPDVNLGTTITQAEADANCKVEDSLTKNADFGAIHLDTNGIPYVIYRLQDLSNVWNHRFSYWTGAAWTAPVTITVAKAQGNYADFIVNSATDIEAYLTASGFTGTGPAPIVVDRGGDIERWDWNGAVWSKTSTILYEKQVAFTLNNAQIVRNFNAGLRVVFTETYVDNYAFDVSDNVKVYAYSGSTFVTRSDTPGDPDVETDTDSPPITAGQVQLGSGLGDAFNTADADGITRKWHLGRYIGVGTDAGLTRADASMQSASKGYLRMQTGSGATDGWGVISDTTISGDFDVRVKPARSGSESSVNFFLSVLNEDVLKPESSGTVDGVVYQQFWQTGTGGDRRFTAYSITNGAYTGVGAMTQFTAGNSFDRWLRITRVGNAIKWYYNTTGSETTWTQDESATFTFAGASHAVLSVNANTGRIPAWNTDSFQFVSTTLDAGGYRTSGSWTSPAVSVPSSGSAATVRLTHSSLSSTYAIDRVEIRSGGVVRKTWEDDITGGTSTDLSVGPGLTVSGSVDVVVTLKGDGAGTPVLESVELVTESFGGGTIHGVSARFGTIVDGQRVEFFDRSISDLPIVERKWVFGDGTVSNLSDPVHVYAFAELWASYGVSFRACNSDGVCDFTAATLTLLNWPLVVLLSSLSLMALLAAGAAWRRRRVRRARA